MIDFRNTEVFKVLSPEKIPPLNMGDKLSPMNNSFHPTLNARQATHLAEAVELMRHNLGQLLPIVPVLKENDIEHRSFLLSLNTINSYIYILDNTLLLEKNRVLANLAYSKKAGVK